MYQATEKIYNELKKDAGLKVSAGETESTSYVRIEFDLKNGGGYRIHFVSTDDGDDVMVRVWGLVHVEDEVRAKILPTINEMNWTYRFVKFVLGTDGDINLHFDYPINSPNPAATARKLVSCFVNIVEDSFPKLMKAMWA